MRYEKGNHSRYRNNTSVEECASLLSKTVYLLSFSLVYLFLFFSLLISKTNDLSATEWMSLCVYMRVLPFFSLYNGAEFSTHTSLRDFEEGKQEKQKKKRERTKRKWDTMEEKDKNGGN